ncbi:MAG: hypothetical protein ABJD11_02315 [Gemmatimonadota bacterium]
MLQRFFFPLFFAGRFFAGRFFAGRFFAGALRAAFFGDFFAAFFAGFRLTAALRAGFRAAFFAGFFAAFFLGAAFFFGAAFLAGARVALAGSDLRTDLGVSAAIMEGAGVAWKAGAGGGSGCGAEGAESIHPESDQVLSISCSSAIVTFLPEHPRRGTRRRSRGAPAPALRDEIRCTSYSHLQGTPARSTSKSAV